MVLLFPATGMARSHGDRNRDRIPDRWERAHHLSLKVNQAKRDQDHDGLRNRAEFLAGTDPRNDDSDDDGTEDGAEGAGTVTSFTGARSTRGRRSSASTAAARRRPRSPLMTAATTPVATTTAATAATTTASTTRAMTTAATMPTAATPAP